MQTYSENRRQLPIYGEFDVVVCGGGATGFMAATAAARAGARTLVIERYGILGGTATAALMVEFGSMHDGERRIVGGLPHAFIHRLAAYGGAYFTDTVRHSMIFDPESMIAVCQQMVLEAGARLLLHTWIADAIVEDGRVRGVVVENKNGRQAIFAHVVIDCTGDGDVAARAGAACVQGRAGDGKRQPATLVVTVGGVDAPRFNYNHHDLIPQIQAGRASGDWPIPTDQMFSCGRVHKKGAPDDPRNAFFFINATNVLDCDGTDADSLTRAEVETRRQVQPMLAFLRAKAPGFERCYLDRTAVQVGVRETRRVVGDYTLTTADVLEARHFADGIANGCNSIDVHAVDGRTFKHQYLQPGTHYQVPYRCLLPQRLDGLLVAGRNISAEHAALGSTRVMVVCMPIGEAAGTAAALAARRRCGTRAIDIGEVQAGLELAPVMESSVAV